MIRAAALAAVVSLVAGTAPSAGARALAPDAVVNVASIKPPIVWKPIPFGDTRKRQMGGYSLRHYGVRTWRLRDPAVIVQHYTTGTTWQGAWNTFAANTQHNGEFPGTCAHFVIHTDGTIYQLVRLGIRCRHAVGMNYTSIGIEHVGTSDRGVLDNDRQMRASLRLTVWLMAKFEINVGNVIGHRETLDSPYRYELNPDWRCLVHADFPRRAMREYRHRTRVRAKASGVAVGAGPVWIDFGC
ncbi:MAG: peptidoglycan recognition family protein [Actinomycetota bacterium]